MALDRQSTALMRKQVELLKLLNLYLAHFPKHEKYALCAQIRNNAYQMHALTVEGYKRYHKKTTLQNLDIAHETLRMQLYLANELGYFACKEGVKTNLDDNDRFKKISMLSDQVGAMIGDWIKVNKGIDNG